MHRTISGIGRGGPQSAQKALMLLSMHKKLLLLAFSGIFAVLQLRQSVVRMALSCPWLLRQPVSKCAGMLKKLKKLCWLSEWCGWTRFFPDLCNGVRKDTYSPLCHLLRPQPTLVAADDSSFYFKVRNFSCQWRSLIFRWSQREVEENASEKHHIGQQGIPLLHLFWHNSLHWCAIPLKNTWINFLTDYGKCKQCHRCRGHPAKEGDVKNCSIQKADLCPGIQPWKPYIRSILI